MKLGKRKKDEAVTVGGLSTPAANETKKKGKIIGLVVVTVLLIALVVVLGHKAQQTVKVAMLAENVYKNQVITEDVLKPYDMLQAEYDKYAIVEKDGTTKRRLILWEEREKILNSFAAYPLQADTYAEYRDFVKSRVDNSDSVLYSFPGKEIIPLTIGGSELQSFKTFLQPGDCLNVQASFTERKAVSEPDGYGGYTTNNVEIYRSEDVFKNIMVADLLNEQGESILDIYAGYNDLTVWQQAQLDESSSFKDRTEPKTLLIALTPEEKERYQYYTSKSNVKFTLSMPQRVK